MFFFLRNLAFRVFLTQNCFFRLFYRCHNNFCFLQVSRATVVAVATLLFFRDHDFDLPPFDTIMHWLYLTVTLRPVRKWGGGPLDPQLEIFSFFACKMTFLRVLTRTPPPQKSSCPPPWKIVLKWHLSVSPKFSLPLLNCLSNKIKQRRRTMDIT